MSFLQPWWWALAALAVPIALFHARRRKTVLVSSLLLWREVAKGQPPQRFRLRPPPPSASLFLQLLALFALTLALAGPRFGPPPVDHEIFILDRTASMSTSMASGTRFDDARRFVARAVASLDTADRGGPLVSLLIVGDSVERPVVRARRPATVLATLQSLSPSVAPDAASWMDVSESLEGIRVVGERERITVASDPDGLALAAPVRESAGTAHFVARAFGAPAPTIGLAGVVATPTSRDGSEWRVEGHLWSSPRQDGQVDVSVYFERYDRPGELPWDEFQVTPEGDMTAIAVNVTVPTSGLLTLRVPGDPFTADDVARVSLRSGPVPLRVRTVGSPSTELLEAFGALDAVQVESLFQPEVEARSPRAPGAPGPDVIVIAGDASRLDEDAVRAPVQLYVGGAVPGGGTAPVLAGDPGSTVLAPGAELFDLADRALGVRYGVPVLASAEVLAEDALGPLLQRRVDDDGSETWVAAWNLGSGGWAHEVGFAMFIADLARRAAPRHGSWTDARCIAGRLCDAEPDGVAGTTVDDLGLHVDSESGTRRWTVDSEAGPESLLSAASSTDAPPPRSAGRAVERAALALAALLLAADALLAHRRARGNTLRAPRVTFASQWTRLAAAAMLAVGAVGLPFPWIVRGARTVVVVDPASWHLAGVESLSGQRLSALESSMAVLVAEGAGRFDAARGGQDAKHALESTGELRDPWSVIDLAGGLLAESGGTVALAGLGFPHTPSEQRMARRLVDQRTVVDVVPAPPTMPSEAWISGISVPERVHTGESVPIRISVAGPGATSGMDVELIVDGMTRLRAPVRDNLVAASILAGPIGTRLLVARIVPEGMAGLRVNDTLTTAVNVLPAGRVVVVASEDADLSRWSARARAAGYEVERWSPLDIPIDADDLVHYDVVVLADVEAVSLHPLQQSALEAWVREQGGGVWLSGAERAFGPGGYLQTPLEDMSPLSSRVPGEQPRAALAFVVDRSGSMQQAVSGTSRLDVAKAATVSATELLHPDSEVAVVVFDDSATTLRPLGAPVGLRQALAPVVPGGGTNLYPALEAAYEQLKGTDAEARHVIVLSDGLAQQAPFDPLVSAMSADGITISTVSIGRGAYGAFLQTMARRGGGTFHESEDVRALPGILAQEAMLLSGDPLREVPTTPEFAAERGVFAEDLGSRFPTLRGYVRTTAKPDADVHARTTDGDPILASWRHGVGRVVALATPISGPWARVWSEVPFSTRLTVQVLRWLVRPVLGPGVHVDVTRIEDSLVVEALVVGDDGKYVAGAVPEVVVTHANEAASRSTAMTDLGNGRYVASVPLRSLGRYDVDVVLRGRADLDDAHDATSYVVDAPGAARPTTDRLDGPRALASATGGSLLWSERVDASGTSWRFGTNPHPAAWAMLALLTIVATPIASRRGPNDQGRRP